ncbi:MAG TPA: cation transporter, partial [Pirellulales bacterium]
MSQTTIFHIPALDCPDELTLVERSLRQTPGIAQLRPDYLGRKLRIEFDPERTTTPDILKAIEAAGFPAQVALPVRRDDTSNNEFAYRASRVGTYLGGVLLLAAGLTRLVMRGMDWPVEVLAIASTISSGFTVARAAYRALRLRALDMNILMCVAGTGAIAIGDYFEAATAMFLFGVSLWLERLSLRRAQRGIRSLMDLTPQVAHRIVSGITD